MGKGKLDMKLLILILATRQNPWERIIREGIFETWAAKVYDNIRIIPYYGNNEKCEEKNGDLLLTSPCEDYTKKTLEAFKYLLENYEFDYILRTNVSTYVRVEKFYNWLKNKPRKEYYAGFAIKGQIPSEKWIAAGINMIYSWDIIKKFVDNMDSIDGNLDDQSLGWFLIQNGVDLIDHIERKKLIRWGLKNFENIPKQELERYMFFRCRTVRMKGKRLNKDSNYRDDQLKMKYLDDLFKGKY